MHWCAVLLSKAVPQLEARVAQLEADEKEHLEERNRRANAAKEAHEQVGVPQLSSNRPKTGAVVSNASRVGFLFIDSFTGMRPPLQHFPWHCSFMKTYYAERGTTSISKFPSWNR